MNKYLSIFRTSFSQEFVYKLNFVMWRLRNVLQIFVLFFFWSTIFSDPSRMVFGYDRGKILTYVFGVMIVKAVVFSARTVDIAGDIAKGDLANYLLKPISYFKYWLTRDLSSKALNLIFAVGETLILFFILKPPFYLQTNPWLILAFILSLVLAILIFFYFLLLCNMVAFWAPEMGWAVQFLLVIIIGEFLSGSFIPLDIFPLGVQKVFYALPFPYLIFFPLQVYLGKISLAFTLSGLLISIAWVLILGFFANFIWRRGLRRFAAEGR